MTTLREGDNVKVRVTDTGSGIPPERLAAIFDDFVTTKKRGLGLGLAITKRIVEQLDGTITVASEVGKGTTFTMRFPVALAPGGRGRGGLAVKLTKEESCSNRLVKTDELQIGGQAYSVKYFENETTRGTLRYSSELVLGPADLIILDGNS